LQTLQQLRHLGLGKTKVTPTAADELEQAIPGLRVFK